MAIQFRRFESNRRFSLRVQPLKASSVCQTCSGTYVLDCAKAAADKDSEHERTLFIIAMLKTLYLRVSELSDRPIGSQYGSIFGKTVMAIVG